MMHIIALAFLDQIRSFKEPDATEVNELFRKLFEEYGRKDHPGKWEVIAAYLKVLLIRIEKASHHASLNEKSSKGRGGFFRKFLTMVEQDFSKTHKVSDYCQKLGITPRNLSVICLQYTGKSAKELIDERVISESKRLLKFTNHSIKEIAVNLGFSDQYQFSKYFKKHVSISPGHYRHKML